MQTGNIDCIEHHSMMDVQERSQNDVMVSKCYDESDVVVAEPDTQSCAGLVGDDILETVSDALVAEPDTHLSDDDIDTAQQSLPDVEASLNSAVSSSIEVLDEYAGAENQVVSTAESVARMSLLVNEVDAELETNSKYHERPENSSSSSAAAAQTESVSRIDSLYLQSH